MDTAFLSWSVVCAFKEVDSMGFHCHSACIFSHWHADKMLIQMLEQNRNFIALEQYLEYTTLYVLASIWNSIGW